jgi:fibronectin-binding autotransporter adhesin
MKRLLQLLFFTLTTSLAFSQDISAQDAGFESGTLAGWTASGGEASVVGTTNVSPGGGKNWTVNPYGTKMARIQPTGGVQFNTATASLGLSGAENTAIRNYLTSLGGNSNPTNAGWIKREVTLQAGTTYTFGWNYLSTDYTPFNDGSMMTLTHATNAAITPNLNNSQLRYALLGFTNPGTGNYATGSYGSTGWQQARFTVPETGTYVLGFASFNLGDTSLSPMLFIDEIQGTTTLNGQTFGAVAPNSGSTAPPAEPPPPPPPPPPQFCCGGSNASFNANPTNVTNVNTFVNRAVKNSQVYIEQLGTDNTIVVNQTGTSNNYVEYNGNGNNNTVNIIQSGTSSTTTNYTELNITGNSNTANLTQTSTGGSKGIFATVNNNNNTLTVQQKDAGNHYANIILTGGNKNVDIMQQGSAGHMANVELSGNPVNLNLTQSGSSQQFYSIQHTCATAGGCAAITVTQGQ